MADAATGGPDEGAGPIHDIAQRGEWPWLPTQGCGHLAPHPYCRTCGQVKAVGAAAPMKMGGITNLLSRLSRQFELDGLKLTEAQRRLVVKELERRDADDAFSLTREAQLGLIAATISRYTGLHADTIAEYLRTC